jgi:outer membrane protein
MFMTTFKNTMLMFGVVSMTAFAVPALAADDAAAAPATAGGTFGVINMDKITETSDAGKDIRSQVDAKRKEYVAELSKQEDSLAKTKQQLDKEVEAFKAKQQADKNAAPNSDLEKKISAFQDKYVQWQKMTQNRKEVLAVAYETAIDNLRKQAAEIVAEQAKAKNYSAVFLQNAVMMSKPELDMTDGVIKQANDKIKKIPVDWSAASNQVSGKKK